jgi:hypothetical protein
MFCFGNRRHNMDSYPGPQREVRRFFTPTRLLYLLAFVALILFLGSLIGGNSKVLGIPPLLIHGVDLWKVQIWDNQTTATVIIGLVTLAFVSRQITLGYRPFFNYKCQQTRDSLYALIVRGESGTRYWNVTLQNVGSGPAIVRKSWYRVRFDQTMIAEYAEYEDVMNSLASKGFINGQDCIVTFLSDGWSLAAKSDFTIVELVLEKALKISALDIKVEFEGLLGDRYIKEIFCIPRRGIYPLNPHAQNVAATRPKVK